jgi:hypothetical protein
MNRLIKTTCAIAAEEIGADKADRIAGNAMRFYNVLFCLLKRCIVSEC